MSQTTFLTPEEVAERYRGSISVGTLRNWRSMKIGPSFVKIGKAVLYHVDELDAWDERNRVPCRNSKRIEHETSDNHV
ncbi:helix-turn-helix domain-containing protein [Rhizobium lusitanum]|uniref:helix-turn-helix domain-containing protein n=1 Tax=Rhizobium lusitanum TaxID=293958 RepID=UPI0015717652|nr:helix-turn-helix domain-containing protein [Rhizobium lusitanum]NTJ06906.1 helix-turn-helix domain-containing protein [Rhizobium lusitanum]